MWEIPLLDFGAPLNFIRAALSHADNLIVREFRIGAPPGSRAAIAFLDGLVEKRAVNESVVSPLMVLTYLFHSKSVRPQETLRQAKGRLVSVADLKKVKTSSELLAGILSGVTAILIDGVSHALLAYTQG